MRRWGYQQVGSRKLHVPQSVEVQLLVEAPQVEWGEPIYLATNLNGWNPNDKRHSFRRLSETRFFLKLNVKVGTAFEFKLTRGSWAKVETGPLGQEIPNRSIKVSAAQAFELDVVDWRDRHPQRVKPSTIVGDVRSLGELTIPFLDRTREVVIYLPPGYDRSRARYPVMYLWDGQNLFDEATSYSGEWQVDETCDRLISLGEIPPLIVVGIYNGQEDRLRGCL